MFRKVVVSSVGLFVVLGALMVPANIAQAITVSHATLRGGELRLDGTGAARGIFVMVFSTTSVAGARSSYSDGSFHIQATNFRAPSCQVDVSDGHSLRMTLTLSACTPTSAPTPITPGGLNQ
jgi:hypothetical protein